jgi:hypothetical protein
LASWRKKGTYLRDSATLQSTLWIINAPYNQRSLQSTPLLTAWINHQIWGQYMYGAPVRLSVFGARNFPTVITTSVVQDLKEKIAGVDCMMRWSSIALHVSSQSHLREKQNILLLLNAYMRTRIFNQLARLCIVQVSKMIFFLVIYSISSINDQKFGFT